MEERRCAREGQPFLTSSVADAGAFGGSQGEPVSERMNDQQGSL